MALLVGVVAIALLFDYTNGFHDAANAVATSISTRAVPPNVALLGAAVLNVAGALVSTHIAATLASGIVDARLVTLPILLGGLAGAITWNLITWWWAIPNSSSHCLIGGMAGAVIATRGAGVKWSAIAHKVLIPTVAAPLIGFGVGIALMVALLWICRRSQPGVVNRRFRVAQTVSASVVAFSHGSNDAQKTMGVIALALFVAGRSNVLEVPTWVKLACAAAIGLGTYAGGKKIIRTLGMRLVKLNPVQGFAAEAASAAVLLSTAQLGFPVSTTHVITAGIMGVGATQRLSAVKWGLSLNIFVAWVITLPVAGVVGGLCARLATSVFGAG